MRFNLYTGNHGPGNAQVALTDHVAFVRYGLEKLGHEVSWSGHDRLMLKKNAMNLMWEFFIPTWGKKIREFGSPYGIILTEHFVGNGFNDMSATGWRNRYAEFVEAAKGAKFLMTYFAQDVEPLKQKFPGMPVSYLEWGFCEDQINEQPELIKYDFAFFGSIDTHRRIQLDKLAKRKVRIWDPKGDIVSAETLNTVIRQSRIILDIRGQTKIPIPSVARCSRAMHAKRMVGLERTLTNQSPTTLCVMQPAGMPYVDYCMAMLESAHMSRAEQIFTQYRERFPMKQSMARALEAVM